MAAYNNPYLFDKIVLVSPEGIRHAMINPGKHSNIRKMLLNTPVLGTMLYNIFVNRHEINRKFTNELFAYQNMIPRETCKAYHETAHLGGASAKYLDNCIYIVSGDKNTDMRAVIKEYTDLNPAIETYLIPNAKVLPQIEQPEEFVNTLNIYINQI